MAATSFAPRLARSKSGADLLFDRLKQEQYLNDEKLAIDYLNDLLQVSIPYEKLHHELKDGVLLCNLVNKLKPGTIKQVGQKDLSFIMMDNITRFLQGAKQLGLSNSQLFETKDLFEGKDMTAVVQTILAISRLSKDNIANKKKPKSVDSSDENKTKHAGHQSSQDIKTIATDPSTEEDSSTKHRNVRDIFSRYSDSEDKTLTRPTKSPLRSRQSTISEDSSKQPMPRKKKSMMLESTEETHKHSHTFPNRGNMIHPSSHATKKRNELEGGSLGHKLDRQYRETADDILSEKPDKEEIDKEERILTYTKEGSANPVQYQLGNCIGKGQFGSVYRTLDLSTGEIVAVKRLCLEDGDIDQEIMKEVALLKTLSHTNVIRYLGFIQSKKSINIILEYAENGSLMSTLKAFGAFPEKLVASFCIKILHGLDYLHQNQVVHCDLKAANILTTKTGDVKLTDFGVSLNLKIKGADAGAVSGTPNWMAPEVIELKGASTKSDIWSLGCTLVELVTGKPPYADMIAMSAMFRIVEDPCPPLPESISEDLKNFLRACFQKDPELRPSAAELKEHPWILKNQQRIKKTETYSHDLSSYLKLQPATDEPPHSCGSSTTELNESQLTLFEDEEPDMKIPIGLRNEEDYITHRFIYTSFGKVVECKVCGELMKTQSIFCEVCALICHEECKKSAFSCPPKVNDQQPSYDWVFSAKIYNNKSRSNTESKRSSIASNKSVRRPSIQLKQEDSESIQHYAVTLGLTPQEIEALKGNQALLSHTLSLQSQQKNEPNILRRKTLVGRNKDEQKKNKKHLNGKGQSEECIIS